MSYEDIKILKFNQCQKSDKAPSIISAYLECLIENIDGYKNNPEISSTTKVDEQIPLGFSMSIISTFKCIENKHELYRGEKQHGKVLRILKRTHNADH